MHEMSLAQSIVDIALDEAAKAQGDQVRRIQIEVGALACVDPHALAFGFEAVSNGTKAEGAILDVISKQAKAYCFSCDQAVIIAKPGDCCPMCDAVVIADQQGQDLRVTALEVV